MFLLLLWLSLPAVPRWGTSWGTRGVTCRLLGTLGNNASCSANRDSASVVLTCSCASTARFEDGEGFCRLLTPSLPMFLPLSPSDKSSSPSLRSFLLSLYLNYSHLSSLIFMSPSFLYLTYFSWEINLQRSGERMVLGLRPKAGIESVVCSCSRQFTKEILKLPIGCM